MIQFINKIKPLFEKMGLEKFGGERVYLPCLLVSRNPFEPKS